MTIDEQIEVMQHFRDGGEVEVSKKGEYSWKLPYHILAWNFDEFDYRKKPEPKTRLMTAEELKGKWIKRGKRSQMVIAIVDDQIETVTEGPKTVKKFHENGWTLEDGSPLTVEVEDE